MLDLAADSTLSTSQVVLLSERPRPAAHPCLSSGQGARWQYILAILCTRERVEIRLPRRLGQPQSCMLATNITTQSHPRTKLAAPRRMPAASQRSSLLCSLPSQRAQKIQLTSTTLVVVMQRLCIKRASKSMSPAAATDTQQRSRGDLLFSAGCICTPRWHSDRHTHKHQIVSSGMLERILQLRGFDHDSECLPQAWHITSRVKPIEIEPIQVKSTRVHLFTLSAQLACSQVHHAPPRACRRAVGHAVQINIC